MNQKATGSLLACHPVLKRDIVQAESTTLYDAAGNRWNDFSAGIWCAALGHSHPRVNDALRQQLDQVTNLHYLLTSGLAGRLAETVLPIAGLPDGKAVFLSSGSEAVQLAMQLALRYTGKHRLLTFSSSYLSAYANTKNRQTELWVEISPDHCEECPWENCPENCPYLSNLPLDEVAAFLLEPGFSPGVRFPSKKLTEKLAETIRKKGGVVVSNEVTTGFGRTGKWFGWQHYDLQPDMVALGKSFGNGYPISGVLMEKAIGEKLEKEGFWYVQSHQNDPLGCAAALAVINVMTEEKMIDRAASIGSYFKEQLEAVAQSSSLIQEVRGRGLMLAVVLKNPEFTESVQLRLLEKGHFFDVTGALGVLRFYPALVISTEAIDSLCRDLAEVLHEMATKEW